MDPSKTQHTRGMEQREVIYILAFLLAVSAGNSMGRRLEKSSRHGAEDTTQTTAFADKHLQIASGTIDVARKHDDDMHGLLPVQRTVPSGPNPKEPPYDRVDGQIHHLDTIEKNLSEPAPPPPERLS